MSRRTIAGPPAVPVLEPLEPRVLLSADAVGGVDYTSTHSFTHDALGSHPGTVTGGSSQITVDLSALPAGTEIYRAIFVHNRAGNTGGADRAAAPLQIESADEPENWLAALPPRHYHLDCTAAVQRAAASPTRQLVLNIVSFAEFSFSAGVRIDVTCDLPAAGAVEQVQDIAVTHRDGDTMVTFTEIDTLLPDANTTVAAYETVYDAMDDTDVVRYRVYRSDQPIDATTIRSAELVDEVRPLSAWNPYYYGLYWRDKDASIVPRLPVADEVPAGVDTGIYVRRAGAAGEGYYAVSTVVNGAEDLSSWTGGENAAAGAVAEATGDGMVLLREKKIDVSFMYESDADLYYYVRWDAPPDYNLPSSAFDYLVAVPEAQAAERPVDVALHCWGATLNGGYGWWYEADRGALLLSTNMTPYDWWTAYHDNYGTIRPFTDVDGNGGGRVSDYPQDRIGSFLDDFVAENWSIDDDRILLTGSSMGGSGAISWGARAADRFAYANGWVGVYIPRQTPQFKGSYEGVYGKDAWDCEYEDTGLSAFDYWDSARFILSDPAQEVPYLCFANGKNDSAIGWGQAWTFVDALIQARQPFKFNWGQSGHGQRSSLPNGNDRYIGLTLARDATLPAFTNGSLDDRIGNGDPADGDPVGAINAYTLWDPETSVDRVDRWEMTVYLLSTAPEDSCTVDVTPRRCQNFDPVPGTVLNWTNTDVGTGAEIARGTAVVDEYGLVTLPGLTLTKAPTRIEIVYDPGDTPPEIVSDLTADGVVGAAFAYTLYAAGTPPMTYGATALPAWADFDEPSHSIVGTPDAAHVHYVTLTAENAFGTDSETLTITVHAQPINQAPTVDAGGDLEITLPEDTVFLNATVVDDGLPDPPAAVTSAWTQESGPPGGASFDDDSAEDTDATFAEPGTYVLRLTADDGELDAYDEVTVTVNPDGTPPAVEGVTAETDFTHVTVAFSEKLDQASATDPGNYAVDHAASVLAAELAPDQATVTLTTSVLFEGHTYTLTVNGVTDAADPPNPVAPGTQETFLLAPPPVALTYKGAFKTAGDFGYGQEGMAYYPAGDGGDGALYLTGIYGRIGQIDIPAPDVADDAGDLPVANTLIGPTTTPMGIKAMEYLPAFAGQTDGHLYYGADSPGDSHGWCDLAPTGSPPDWNGQGPWPLAADNRRVGHYVTGIDQGWVDANLPGSGKVLATGFGWQGYGHGPDLYAYNPFLQGGETTLRVTKLIEYDAAHPWGGFVSGDAWEAGAWVTAGDGAAVLIGGQKATEDGGGTTCAAAILIYDADDLAAVAAGTMQTYQPEPTVVSAQDQMFSATLLSSMAYDGDRNVLYASEYVSSTLQIVHAWDVAAPRPPLTPGDANGDGTVDVLDLAVVANHFGQAGAYWKDGDFDGDGGVDVLDLAVVANHFGAGGGGGAASTPAHNAGVAPEAAGTPAYSAGVAPDAAGTPAYSAGVAPGVASTPAYSAGVAPGSRGAMLTPSASMPAHSAGMAPGSRGAMLTPSASMPAIPTYVGTRTASGEPAELDVQADLLAGPELAVLPTPLV